MVGAELKIALLGCGVVGTAVATELFDHQNDLSARAGTQLRLHRIAVRDVTAARDSRIPTALFTDEPETAITDADLVIEVMGGIEPAKSLITTALQRGASVITANKALIAAHGAELFSIAKAAGVTLSYEAAVAGAIPLIRPIKESLAGDRITKVLGIVNGTTNYVLDQMHTTGASLAEAIEAAQKLGFAEADPTADVAGHDAAAKAAILASLAFHTHVPVTEVNVEGITGITATDVAAAINSDQVIKLLAICTSTGGPEPIISARVHPALIPAEHPLASVRGPMNAVFLDTESAGPLMFYGAGAGGQATASSILGDLVSAARLRHQSASVPAGPAHHSTYQPATPKDIHTRYNVRLEVLDKPGVLQHVAEIFAQEHVSLYTVQQTINNSEQHHNNTGTATLLLLTHTAAENQLSATVAALEKMPAVVQVASVLRVEGNS